MHILDDDNKNNNVDEEGMPQFFFQKQNPTKFMCGIDQVSLCVSVMPLTNTIINNNKTDGQLASSIKIVKRVYMLHNPLGSLYNFVFYSRA